MDELRKSYVRPDANSFIFFAIWLNGGVAEWLKRSVSNHVSSARVGSKPVVGTTDYKPTVNSAVHPFVVCT